ncbi:chemotaxis protein [Paucimonas lemoignei]|nr:chemotaxis protein [Paucimonas lemoignei]
MILEVAVAFLGVAWVVTLSLFLAHTKRQRQLDLEREEADAKRDQRIRELLKRVDNFQNGTVKMGEALHELRATVAPLPDKLTALEQRDPANLSFAQAARLVGMGASVDELTQACGLTQAEAQLMSKLHSHNQG